MTFKTVDTVTFKDWLDKDEAVFIDVRTVAEHQTTKIPGTLVAPMDTICCSDLPKSDKKIVLYCRTSRRSKLACEKLLKENDTLDIYILEDGLEAWKAAGLPMLTGSKKTISLERQIQLTVGSFVLVASILILLGYPSFAWLSGFFGAGLTFAGLSGTCGMGIFLSKMPWNR